MDQQFIDRLADIVGYERVRFNRQERKAYSVDIGVMPPLVEPFVNAGLPGAIVRPETEEQIASVLRLARDARVPVVARGGATSGYGGVLPHKDALVIDMAGWSEVVEIDEQSQVVTCQPGVIWEELDVQLKRKGLTLRMYPSSYPASTVGGMLAQGGSGFGSYEYGSFKDNVVSARVIDVNGDEHEYKGADLLQLVADAEGITGVITQVSFKVRADQGESVRLIALPTTAALGAFLEGLYEEKVPLWSLTFLNPESVRLKKLLPGRTCHEFERAQIAADMEMEKKLPEAYLVMCAYPEDRAELVEFALDELSSALGGEVLPQESADHEWRNRTSPMRLKRLGPSIIPTEVIVPYTEVAAVLDEIDAKISQGFVLEGMMGADGGVVFLGYIPHDERSFAFNPAFALSLSVIAIANAHGGKGYATGLYFRNEGDNILGVEKIGALKSFKANTDPNDILNPGKVVKLPGGGWALDALMGAAMKMEPLVRPIANAAKPKKRGPGAERNHIPGKVAYMATACSRCGYCVHTCEQYEGSGWESQSPRGKYTWMREVYAGREKWDRPSEETILGCTTCERCDVRCQLELPVSHDGMRLRPKLVDEAKMGTFPPFEMMAASLEGEGDIWAGKREHRADWLPEDIAADLPEKADALYFAGCTASYVENDIAEASIRLLRDSGLNVGYLGTKESCCGIPMKMAGKEDLFEQQYRSNTAAARAVGATTIVTSCPACALVWKEMYPELAKKLGEPYEFEVKHYSEVVAPALADGTLKLTEGVFDGHTVTFHDSCHAGRAQGIYEQPREMLAAIPGIDLVEMEHNREEGICCGSVITLVGNIDTAPKLGCARLQEAVDAGADTVIAACPCCQVQLRDSAEKGGLDLKIDDLARVVANAAGYSIPTSEAKTSYMWSYFDKFIRLMDPKHMAQFMVQLFPQMLDAMPVGMGGMMRSVGKTSFGSSAMAKMMPVMFPKMAPSILDKVMPDMVAAVEDYIGEMPADMAALMPDLLPKTMASLMPSYMPQLIPYLVPLFIDYLRTGSAGSGSQGVVSSKAA